MRVLKNKFTEDEKYHNLMNWLKYITAGLLKIVDKSHRLLFMHRFCIQIKKKKDFH